MKFVIRWIAAFIALCISAWLIPGIHVTNDGLITYAVMALVLSLLNATLLPLLKFLSCGMIILTLGLFQPSTKLSSIYASFFNFSKMV